MYEMTETLLIKARMKNLLHFASLQWKLTLQLTNMNNIKPEIHNCFKLGLILISDCCVVNRKY